MQDVDHKDLHVGDRVAFCMAGRSSDMRVGTVIKLFKAQVEIEYQVLEKNYYTKVESLNTYTLKRHAYNVAKLS